MLPEAMANHQENMRQPAIRVDISMDQMQRQVQDEADNVVSKILATIKEKLATEITTLLDPFKGSLTAAVEAKHEAILNAAKVKHKEDMDEQLRVNRRVMQEKEMLQDAYIVQISKLRGELNLAREERDLASLLLTEQKRLASKVCSRFTTPLFLFI
ncbi:hypothetical protein NHQ30_007783 [Ciborinia camelliae]|nr:hypothetical protein NHQ30_007783 [Ciborinia camelliae]